MRGEKGNRCLSGVRGCALYPRPPSLSSHSHLDNMRGAKVEGGAPGTLGVTVEPYRDEGGCPPDDPNEVIALPSFTIQETSYLCFIPGNGLRNNRNTLIFLILLLLN